MIIHKKEAAVNEPKHTLKYKSILRDEGRLVVSVVRPAEILGNDDGGLEATITPNPDPAEIKAYIREEEELGDYMGDVWPTHHDLPRELVARCKAIMGLDGLFNEEQDFTDFMDHLVQFGYRAALEDEKKAREGLKYTWK